MTNPIVRQRLFKLLTPDHRQPCIWVTAAAGYGKTSLLTSYLEHIREPCLWYVLQSADNDLMRFFQHFTGTIKKQFPTLDLPEISLINMADPEEFAEAFFNAFKIVPIILVFDDYHHLDADSLVHRAICSGLEKLQKGRFLIASREHPPAPFIRLVANEVIDLISTDTLRFTFEETRQLLTQQDSKEITDHSITTLHTMSEGWVAGLILLIKQQQMGHLPRITDGLISGYF